MDNKCLGRSIKSSFQQAQEAATADTRPGHTGSGHTVTAVYARKMTIFTQILEGLNPGVAKPAILAIQTFQIRSGMLSWVGFQTMPQRVDRRTHVNVVTSFCRKQLISPPCSNVNYSRHVFMMDLVFSVFTDLHGYKSGIYFICDKKFCLYLSSCRGISTGST